MAGIFNVSIEGDLVLFIQAKIDGLSNGEVERDILDDCQAILLNRIRTRFLATEAPDGSKWAVSKASIDRALSGRDGKTGFDKGNLFHSIQAYLPDEHSRTIGTDVFYAGYFGLGTKKMPARPFLGFSNDDLTIVQNLVLRHVKDYFEAPLS